MMRARRGGGPALLLIGLLTLAALGPAGPPATADDAPTTRRTGLGADRDVPSDARARLGATLHDAEGPVEVVAVLSESPVLRARPEGARAMARRRERIARQQTAVTRAARAAAAARPTGRVREALNAVAFRLDAADLDALAALDGVDRVLAVPTYRTAAAGMRRQVGVTDDAGDRPHGRTGQGVRIAVLDSGVDYTHAALGGSGDVDAYDAAAEAKQAGAPPREGFPNDVVVDGADFVGADWQQPGDPREPSANPLDLEGHGTAVAAMAAGRDGVAPDAELLAGQVCSSTTPFCDGVAILEGIDWAIAEGADVINLSFGVPYLAPADDPAGLAAAEAVAAGVSVVAAAGNDADRPYASGSPASAPGVIAVAETVLDGAEIEQPLHFAGLADADGVPVTERVGVLQRWSQTPTAPLDDLDVVVGEPPGDDGFCDGPPAADVEGAAVLVFGSSACADSEKVANVARAGGALALIAVPTPTEPGSSAPRECPEGACHDVPGYALRAEDLVDVDELTGEPRIDVGPGATVSLDPESATPRADRVTGSTSRGPRVPDGGLKPDLAAPGSAAVAHAGSGDAVRAFGGTSGAAPVVAGAAALVLADARDDGAPADPETVKARLVGTADPTIAGEGGARAAMTRQGAGQLRVDRALGAEVVAVDAAEPASGPMVSFGLTEVVGAETLQRDVEIRNVGPTDHSVDLELRDVHEPAGWTLSAAPNQIDVDAGGSATVTVAAELDPAALPSWPLDSGLRGGQGQALSQVEATARLAVSVDGGVDSAAGVHGLARLAADLRADRATLTGDGVAFTNQGAETGQVDVFDLLGRSDGTVSSLGAFSAPLGQGDALLSVAVTFDDRVAHANSRHVEIDITAVDGDGAAHLIVTDVGLLLFGYPVGESVTILGAPTATPGVIDIVDAQTTDHGLHSPNLLLPSIPTLVAGLEPGDLVNLDVAAYGGAPVRPLDTVSGRVRLGASRYEASLARVAPGETANVAVIDHGAPPGTSAAGVLALLDGPAADLPPADPGAPTDPADLPPFVGAPPGRETLVLPEPVTRLSGADRFATAAAISADRFAAGDADTVVLVRADDFADALAGASLAAQGDGPLLLTPRDRLHPATGAEIDRILADDGEVVLLGGAQALSGRVADAVAGRGHAVRRLAGSTRVGTALAVADELGDPDPLLVADGFDFPDALAAGAAAAATDGAVLLTTPEQAPDAVRDHLDARSADTWAVGGPAARAVPGIDSIVGSTRFETAEALAGALFDEPTQVGIARGDDFPDALAGGAHAGGLGGPVLLSTPGELHPSAGRWLCARRDTIARGFAYGGTAALDERVLGDAAARLHGDGC